MLLAITQGATTIIASVFRARGEAGRFAVVTTLFTSVGRAAVALVALLLGADAAVVLWTFVALNAGLIALTWRSAMRGLPPGASEPEGYGAMQLGGVVWSLMGNLDVVVVGVVLGAADAGTYGASLRIAEVAVQFFVALSVLYLPEATRLAITGRVDALGALYRTTGGGRRSSRCWRRASGSSARRRWGGSSSPTTPRSRRPCCGCSSWATRSTARSGRPTRPCSRSAPTATSGARRW